MNLEVLENNFKENESDSLSGMVYQLKIKFRIYNEKSIFQKILDIRVLKGPLRYDAILMDIFMPFLSGFKATKIIRNYEKSNNLNPIPIIIISGNATKKNMIKA